MSKERPTYYGCNNDREADEIDDEILEVTKEVSKFAFPEHGVPTMDNVLTGFKDIISDTIFNAPATITARKIAEKVHACIRPVLVVFPWFHYFARTQIISMPCSIVIIYEYFYSFFHAMGRV